MSRPPLNDLFAFLAVAKQRSFRRAAVDQQVSPSALSHAVRTLEERLGVRLLNRTTRNVGLTDAGARLSARLLPAFASVDEALAELRNDTEDLRGRIRITTMEYGAQLLVDHVVNFQAQHPGVEVELYVDLALIDLAADGFDAGVRFREQVPPDMGAIPIAPRSGLAAAASPEYLARRGEPQTPSDLVLNDCIRQRLARGAVYRWEFEDGGRELAINPSGPLTLNSLPIIVAAALNGAGICYVPLHHIALYFETGSLVRLLEPFSTAFDGHSLYYSPYRHQTRAFAAFPQHLKRSLPANLEQ